MNGSCDDILSGLCNRSRVSTGKFVFINTTATTIIEGQLFPNTSIYSIIALAIYTLKITLKSFIVNVVIQLSYLYATKPLLFAETPNQLLATYFLMQIEN